jgi:hypothetical protein
VVGVKVQFASPQFKKKIWALFQIRNTFFTEKIKIKDNMKRKIALQINAE